jgi:hypothetical protein
MAYIVVLNDGETYSDLDGARVYEVPNNWDGEDIEAMLYGTKESEREYVGNLPVVPVYRASWIEGAK